MKMHRLARFVPAALLAAISPAVAQGADKCVNVKVELTPTDSLQMVAWLEKADGTFVETLYITAKTGLYGLGNRPGRYDFNSGPVPNASKGIDDMWPYGRRITTFPVWAHRHGLSWPLVVFQDDRDSDLSHSLSISSREVTPPYCRPVSMDGNPQCWDTSDKQIWDTGSCATTVFTDKGKFSPSQTSLYPPRADLTPQDQDSPSVLMYRTLNPFDAVSRATPPGGMPFVLNWPVPTQLESGSYVLFVEASKAFDFNATYNSTVYPAPMVSYGSCGLPYRGQPSVVYRVPFDISATQSTGMTSDYVGYGDPTGAAGTLNPPDSTITTDTPGSGSSRLQLVSDGGNMFRLRVTNIPQLDYAEPGAADQLQLVDIKATTAVLQFVEPGDDGLVGSVSGYQVRMRANQEITEENFAESMNVLDSVTPVGAGEVASVNLEGLLPETDYYVAVRAYDDCHKSGPLTVTKFTTGDRVDGTDDACFVATAAYGSLLANDVEVLRHVRDSILARPVFGELASASYYTFGPAVAGVVGQSDTLRATARGLLTPLISRVRRLRY
jgi:hypothetical protein